MSWLLGYGGRFECNTGSRVTVEKSKLHMPLLSLLIVVDLKGQCHEIVIEMRIWSSRLGLN
jgi:hypothetical protein